MIHYPTQESISTVYIHTCINVHVHLVQCRHNNYEVLYVVFWSSVHSRGISIFQAFNEAVSIDAK